MRTWRAKAPELFRQWQVARDRRKQARRQLLDEREAEHVERLRAGIKDVHPPTL